jgi:adenylate cyclase, class 2
MPLEIEVKLRSPSLAAARAALQVAGAVRVGIFHETNLFFDRPDGSLRAHDTGLRIRFSRKEGETAVTALFTFKGPKQSSRLQPREAFDLTVVPADEAVGFLTALGFEQTHAFEKRRESWEFGGCKIELDELPAFGTFVEIEGPSEEIVLDVQKRLGLADLEVVKTSYSAMVAQHVRQHSVPANSLIFG